LLGTISLKLIAEGRAFAVTGLVTPKVSCMFRFMAMAGLIFCSTWQVHTCSVSAQEATTVLPKRTSVRPTTAWDESLRKQLNSGNRWAILIGVDHYQHSAHLQCCVADVNLIAETLITHCGFDHDQVVKVADDQEDIDRKPTGINIIERTTETLKRVRAGDTVVVLFTGHGMLLDKAGYLCPNDFDGRMAEQTALKIDDLRNLMQGCPAAQKILILDCCHSGASSGFAQSASEPKDFGTNFEFAQGQITFSACRANQSSVENRAVGHGVFVTSFVRGLQGAADFDQNRIVDSDELYRHLLSEVPALAREVVLTHRQTPVRIIGQDVVGVFALAPVRSGSTVVLKRASQPGEMITNSIGMPLALLPRGCFVMGSPLSEYQRHENESPFPIMISKQLLMGVYEVTQREYQTVMGSNPSYYSERGAGATAVQRLKPARFPVEQVSWHEAAEFCKRLSELPTEREAARIYRLPTDAEWEFACRANANTAFNVGELIDGTQANIRSDKPYWKSRSTPALERTRTVGSYPPNHFGLCDMHGNVAEWCSDWEGGLNMRNVWDGLIEGRRPETHEEISLLLEQFSEIAMQDQVVDMAIDPVGAVRGTKRVTRGGSFNSDVSQCRSASKRGTDPDYRYRGIGFRVICEQHRSSN
jgi:formylglycine-generating enzyme required for sulfatase activity